MKDTLLSKHLFGLYFNTKPPKETPPLQPLNKSFDKTSLDLENPGGGGGPINDPKSNYIHNYSGKLGKGYLDKYQEARSHNSNFGTEGTDINNNSSFEKTNLDLERESPLGGPLNDSNSGFIHKYTSLNKYSDNYQEARSNNSSFGIEGTNIKPNSTFEITGLDIENPKAGTKQGGSGGPNRTNSNNIPNGQYMNIGANNMFGFKYSNTFPLRNKSNEFIITTLQQYTPNKTYIDTLRLTPNDEL